MISLPLAPAFEQSKRNKVVVRDANPHQGFWAGWGEIFSDIWRSRELIWALARRDIRARYKHSLLGVLWAIFNPLVSMLIFGFIFTRMVTVDTGGIPYALFAYIGLTAWTFFNRSLLQSLEVLITNAGLVKKNYFPRESLPLSRILDGFVDFIISTSFIGCLMFFYSVPLKLSLIFIPMIVLLQLTFMVGLSMLLSVGNLLYRDVGYIMQVVLQLWMWITSVVYPLPNVGLFKIINILNPMTPIIHAYRDLILHGHLTDARGLLVASGIAVLTCLIGLRVFRNMAFKFGELL